jgi:predicted ArsR family transcriptional regulator
MLLPVFQDLIKPQWRTVIETLKLQGALPVSELARITGGSYMAMKTHCEELTKAGYLLRTREPRTEVGRPEIFYSLAAKSDALFPQAGLDFTLELLEHIKAIFGENAPEKLLFLHFQELQETWRKKLEKHTDLASRVDSFITLRNQQGCASHRESAPDEIIRVLETHNPLQRLFEHYPRALALELRMIEQVLGARVHRSEIPAGRGAPPRVVFDISSNGID